SPGPRPSPGRRGAIASGPAAGITRRAFGCGTAACGPAGCGPAGCGASEGGGHEHAQRADRSGDADQAAGKCVGACGVDAGETEAEEGVIDPGHAPSLLVRARRAGTGVSWPPPAKRFGEAVRRTDQIKPRPSNPANPADQAAAIRAGEDRHIQNSPSTGSTAGT